MCTLCSLHANWGNLSGQDMFRMGQLHAYVEPLHAADVNGSPM